MKSVSLKQRLAGKKSLKKNWMQRESVSKQGRKSTKAEPSVHRNPLFNELDDDAIDNMDTEDSQDVGRTRNRVNVEKEDSQVSNDRSKDSTDKEEEGTDKDKDSTISLDEAIAQVLLNMSHAKAVSREKEKGVELKDVEETERPRPTLTRSLLTLKPLPKIDLKDKGKKKIEEEDKFDTESQGIPEAEKKFKQLARDEEMASKLQEDWEKIEERKRLAEEEATKTALLDEYDFIQARIEADRLLALRLQDEERERESSSLNKPPTRTQLRNQMMTYLKHVGNKKHSDLKSKTFEEIQALYEKVKRFDESFTLVGFTEDERRIKEMNKGVKNPDQNRLKEEDTAKVPAKVEVTEQGTKKRKVGYIKMIARKKPRKQSDVDSDDEHRKYLKIAIFEGTIDSEIMENKSVIARLDKEDASKQGRKIEDLDADTEVTLVNETQEMNDDNLMFDTGVLEEQEIMFEKIKTAKPKPVTTAVTTVTSVRPRAKGIIFHDQEEQVPASTKTFSSLQSQLPQVKDKGKGKMVELKKPLKKKDQIALDEEMARNLEAQMQTELIEEERLARQKEEEVNIVLIES
ncbi:hypothetical protein Tco_0973993 [Tanacetum coccineum]|uniref:Uncharacterized protein n=1 Tax=Tanacetum coccineum TaxID=301880 RepID=A0ABQ5EAC7_9ASTR